MPVPSIIERPRRLRLVPRDTLVDALAIDEARADEEMTVALTALCLDEISRDLAELERAWRRYQRLYGLLPPDGPDPCGSPAADSRRLFLCPPPPDLD